MLDFKQMIDLENRLRHLGSTINSGAKKKGLRRNISKDTSFMIIFGMLLFCIQVKQKSFITADVIGTIQINPHLVINYENFIMSSK